MLPDHALPELCTHSLVTITTTRREPEAWLKQVYGIKPIEPKNDTRSKWAGERLLAGR
jgi:hypothetical protein